jgi:hypothetical protein
VGAVQYNSGGNLFGGTANVTVSGSGLSVAGTIRSGNIIPSADNLYFLGNVTNRWANIFLGPGTLYITDSNIAANTTAEITVLNGILQVNGAAGLQANLISGNTTVDLIPSGNITLNAGGSTAELVVSSTGTAVTGNLTVSSNISTNGNLAVSGNINLPTNGNLNFTGGGIRQTGNEDLFITAVDNDGVTISSIGLMPNNKHTRLEQWSSQYSESWTTADWATGTYTVESGQGVVRFTNAANIISFVDSLYGSERIFFSVNGGPQLVSDGFNDGSGNIEFYTPTLPATNPTTVTSFRYYYSYESGLDIDYDSEEFNIFGDNVNINIETVGQKLINIKSFNDLNLESRNLFTLKNRSANNGIQIQTDASNTSPTWEFGADGTTTFPANGIVTLNGNTTVAAGKTLTIDGVATFNDSIVRNGTDSVVVDIVPGTGQIIAEANSPTIIYLTTDDSVIATDLTVIIQYDGNNDTYTEITKLLVTKNSNISNQPNLVVAGQSLTTNSIAPGSYTAGRYAGNLIYVEVTTAPATGNSYVTVKATEFGGYYGV